MASTRSILRVAGRVFAGLALAVVGLYAAWRGLLLLQGQLDTVHATPVWAGFGLCAAGLCALGLGLRLFLVRLDRPWFPIACGLAVVLDAGLAVLGCAWLVHDHPVAGAITGGVGALVPVLFQLGLIVALDDWDLLEDETVFAGLAAVLLVEATLIAVAITAGVNGHPVPAWIFGVVAALPPVVAIGYGLIVRLTRMSQRGGRGSAPPLTTQLLGLIVPVGSMVGAWLVENGGPLPGEAGVLFSALGAWTFLLAAVFVVLRVLLSWTAVERSREFPAGPRDTRRGADRDRRALIEREMASLRREVPRLDEAEVRRANPGAARFLDDLEGELRQLAVAPDPRRASPAWPAVTADVLSAVDTTRHRTGLDIDEVWPRIELVLPTEARGPLRRLERSVNGLRVAVASAATTALVWGFLAGRWFEPAAGPSTYVIACLGPLLVGAALLGGLRQSAGRLYRRRAAAVELYRFDLARSLHVPIPRDPDDFRRAAPILVGRESPGELVSYETAGAPGQAVIGPEQFDAVRDDIVREIRATLLPEIRELKQHQARLTAQIRNPVLDEQQVSALAVQAAEQITEELATDVRERMETLQQAFYQRVGKLIEDSVDAAVTGPAPANFTGFMVIDLKSGAGRPSGNPGEMLSVPVGSVLELSFFVVNDEKARGTAPTLESGDQFFVAEPITIEGGRPERHVEFDAVADSPSLKPVPNRRSLTVSLPGGAVETVFAFQMPSEPGRHEIWFQLYQAGRLVQAVVVHIRAVLASVNG